jgi:hypothetical protein
MTDNQIKILLEREGSLLEQFLFIVYYTDPSKDKCKLIVDDGSIKMTISREKFIYLFNQLLQPRTFEIEKNFQRIKASLNSYGKWYFYDRIKNDFRELLEAPELEKLTPSELFKNTSMIKEEINEKFKATVNEYNEKVLSKAPIPTFQNTILNKFYSFFKELNHPKKK